MVCGERSSRRPMSRKRQPWPRVMLSIARPPNAGRRANGASSRSSTSLRVTPRGGLPATGDRAPPCCRRQRVVRRGRPGPAQDPRRFRLLRIFHVSGGDAVAHHAGDPVEAFSVASPGCPAGRCRRSADSSSPSGAASRPSAPADEAGIGQLWWVKAAQQHRQFRHLGQPGFLRQAHQDAAQQADRPLGPLDVAAQPEEIVGRPARQVARRRGSAPPAGSPGPAD